MPDLSRLGWSWTHGQVNHSSYSSDSDHPSLILSLLSFAILLAFIGPTKPLLKLLVLTLVPSPSRGPPPKFCAGNINRGDIVPRWGWVFCGRTGPLLIQKEALRLARNTPEILGQKSCDKAYQRSHPNTSTSDTTDITNCIHQIRRIGKQWANSSCLRRSSALCAASVTPNRQSTSVHDATPVLARCRASRNTRPGPTVMASETPGLSCP
jgi:hypothetical protein